MLRIIVLLTVLGFPQCVPGEPKWSLRIFNGYKSHEPFVLPFGAYNKRTHDDFTCTASLIKPQYILTAAHCFDPDYEVRYVLYGCSDILDSNCKRMYVIQSMVFVTSYTTLKSESVFADIAVAKLVNKVEGIAPIALPTGRNMEWIPVGKATVVGYGITETGNFSRFQLATDFIIPVKPNNMNLSFTQIPHHESGVLGGDSGGPLIINQTLYGVLSGGFKMNKATNLSEDSVYTNVNYFREFIDTSIEQLEKFQPALFAEAFPYNPL